MMTLNEPKGVTSIGGAKEYAAKFATGDEGVILRNLYSKNENETHIRPAPLAAHQRQVRRRSARNDRQDRLTYCHPCPPDRIS